MFAKAVRAFWQRTCMCNEPYVFQDIQNIEHICSVARGDIFGFSLSSFLRLFSIGNCHGYWYIYFDILQPLFVRMDARRHRGLEGCLGPLRQFQSISTKRASMRKRIGAAEISTGRSDVIMPQWRFAAPCSGTVVTLSFDKTCLAWRNACKLTLSPS